MYDDTRCNWAAISFAMHIRYACRHQPLGMRACRHRPVHAGTYLIIRGCVQNPARSIYGEGQNFWTLKRAVTHHLAAKSFVWQIKICGDLARPVSGGPCCFKIPPTMLPQKYKPTQEQQKSKETGSKICTCLLLRITGSRELPFAEI